MIQVPPRLVSALETRYRIDAVIGHGGMADVYRATDPKHQRSVALKVLRPDLAASVGTERFLAEVQTTANLQHPHILPLFDSGEAEGFLYYVMPYVEGESLADRLAREKQLPIDEAVQIARTVASALDYAHRHGVIHRDIKPANILLNDGQALIADFGIALALEAAGGERLTATGLRVGTPAYMSPEQIAGDSRIGPSSDVYALGCVLYEMLAGEPPYTAPTVEALLARIVRGDHGELVILRKGVPKNVAAAIERSLEAVPADRFRSAHDFAEALSNSAFRHRDERASAPPTRFAALALAGWLVAGAVALGWGLGALRDHPSEHVARFTMEIPSGQRITGLSPAPDGRAVFYAARGVYRRTLESFESELIPGTEGATDLSVGPGGEWLAFVKLTMGPAADTLFKARISGGPPVKLADHPSTIRGIAWDSSGYLILGSGEGGLWRVPAAGGTLEPLTTAQRAAPHRSPHVLPGARGILFHIFGSGPGDRVAVMPRGSSEWRVLTEGRDPVFVAPSHLVFYRYGGAVGGGGSLWVAPFDLDRLELSGDPEPIVTGVRFQSRPLAAWSSDGSLYYVANSPPPPRPLAWVAKGGVEEPLQLRASNDPGEFSTRRTTWSFIRLSPDGQTVLQLHNARLWLGDLRSGGSERLTGESAAEWEGLWLPDGREIVFRSRREGPFDIYRIPLHGTRRIEALGTNGGAPQDWTPDGKSLLYIESGLRLWSLEHRTSQLLLDEPIEWARMSSTGRFLAYHTVADESMHVYVRPYPDLLSNRWKIPTAAAMQPIWSPDGRELYYLENGALMVVPMDPARGPEVERARVLLEGPFARYDVAPDGRFLVIRLPDQPDSSTFDRISVVQNWLAEFEPPSRKH